MTGTSRLHSMWMAGAVGFPLAAMAVWLAYVAYGSGGAPVTLAVAGFDPRDLLSGHFLTYRVAYGADVCPASAPKDHAVCVCLNKGEGQRFHTAAWFGACADAAASCADMLSGACRNGQFVAGIERFYFDERYADKLRLVPPDASITVGLRGGQGTVTGMQVGGVSLEQWLEDSH